MLAHLLYPGHAAALGIAVMAALNNDVDQWVGRRMELRFGDQRQELRDIVIVHRMHRGEMRADDAALEPEPPRLTGKRLDMARHRIIGLIAMHVVEELTFGRDLAQFRNAPRAVRDRALEMGYPADHIDAHIERPG